MLRMIKSLLTFGMTAVVSRSGFSLMTVAVKRLPRFDVLSLNVWRRIEVIVSPCAAIGVRRSLWPWRDFNGLARFIGETGGVHFTCIVKMVPSP